MTTRRWRRLNRRTFFGGAALAGLGAVWTGFSSSFTARFLRERVAETFRSVPPARHKPAPSTWSDQNITLSWLGHSTVLIDFFGLRILTDPVFFPRIGLDAKIGTIGPKRLAACALAPIEIPEIDLVLVSHAHFDHLDIPSLAAIRGKPAAVMAASTSDLLPRGGYSSVHELRWGEKVELNTPRGDVAIYSLEVRHWGARMRRDTYRGYAGYVIEREGHRLLFGGDTADTPLFAGYRRFGPFAAAIMPVGAYQPWIRSHCTPEQAVAMANDAGAELFVPVHHQTFKLSSERFGEPIERTLAALAKEPERLAIREMGQTAIVV